MTRIASDLTRSFTCAAAALLITVIASMSFVQSTSVTPAARAAMSAAALTAGAPALHA
jgi:hypothetical protein